jgi:hypothetical protein
MLNQESRYLFISGSKLINLRMFVMEFINSHNKHNENADFLFSTTRNEHDTANCSIAQNITINRTAIIMGSV